MDLTQQQVEKFHSGLLERATILIGSEANDFCDALVGKSGEWDERGW